MIITYHILVDTPELWELHMLQNTFGSSIYIGITVCRSSNYKSTMCLKRPYYYNIALNIIL